MATPALISWSIPGSDNHPILGDTHRPPADVRALGHLLIAHGFKGYKDYGFLPMLAHRAALAGLIAHRFNFSHSGMTNHLETFEHPELFERETWGRQMHDLQAVAQAVHDGRLPGASEQESRRQPVVFFGHSRGGVTCLLTAAQIERDGQPHLRPAGVVTAASPHRACSLDDEARNTLRTEGRLLSPSGRTGQDLYVGRCWLDDIEQHPEARDPYRAAGVYPGPRLIVHGTADTTVPVAAAHAYLDAPSPPDHTPARLELIEGASHTFDAPNPLPTDAVPPAATETLIEATITFASACCDTNA